MTHGTAKALAMAGVALLCLLMFAGGAGFAIWFNRNFAIVPKAEFMDSLHQALQESQSFKDLVGEQGLTPEQIEGLLAKETLGQLLSGEADVEQVVSDLLDKAAKPATGPDGLADAWAMDPAARAAQAKGGFRFKFTPGETLKYRLSARIDGQGTEDLGPAPIDMNMDSGFELHTRSVDHDGYGKLRLEFAETQVKGDFMGGPFSLRHDRTGTSLQMNGVNYIDSAAKKGSAAGIPQLEFFNAPIDMEVAPNGVVTAVSGDAGMGGLLGSLPMFTDLEFPEEEMVEGGSWVSHVTMPVPGIGTPIATTIVNTFTGYKTIGTRLCAVIDQEITSEQTQGTITAPGGVFGAATGFMMPQFKLGGMNKVYFDAENGQMVHSDLDLDLGIDIGKSLGISGPQLNGLMQNLGDILRDVPELEAFGDLLPAPRADGKPSPNLLEMNVDITAQISLTEPAMPVH